MPPAPLDKLRALRQRYGTRGISLLIERITDDARKSAGRDQATDVEQEAAVAAALLTEALEAMDG